MAIYWKFYIELENDREDKRYWFHSSQQLKQFSPLSFYLHSS